MAQAARDLSMHATMSHRVSHPDDVRMLRVSSSGYYGWVARASSARTQENVRLLARIRALHADQDGVVDCPRIWEGRRNAGERCGRHRVARLMRRAGLYGVPQVGLLAQV